jgi:hypothetical protein
MGARLTDALMSIHFMLPCKFALTERAADVPVFSPLMRQTVFPVIREDSRVDSLKAADNPIYCWLVACKKSGIV